MTMIEKIARVLCAANGGDSESGWNLNWRDYTDDARAALTAMLEPSEGMIEAGWRSASDDINGRPVWKGAVDVAAKHRYTAMIHHALQESER